MTGQLNITPIETVYRGYRFRSRLEARWAVFFDHCGEQFIYEHEGFRLPRTGPYLPDFYFPRRKAFLEVKPSSAFPIDCFDLEPFSLLKGDQLPRELMQMVELTLLLKTPCGFHVVAYGDPLSVLDCDEGGSITLGGPASLYVGVGFIDLFSASLYAAADAARGARFEHGVSGALP